MPAYALTIFTGAFLLFQVQPLIGKYILPWFGGGPGVWTTCMLFFQVVLLGGYAYAHFASRWLKPRPQVVVHLVLVVAALALLPITPDGSWKPSGGQNPTLQILELLTASLGLPYFILASTGPLMQQWFSLTHTGASPYRLYALSNAGSLLALVSYPFYFETHFTRRTQAALWGWGLAVYAVGCALCGLKFWNAARAECPRGQRTEDGGRRSASGLRPPTSDLRPPTSDLRPPTSDLRPPTATPDPHPSTLKPQPLSQPSTRDRFLWLLLPACASVLLLATTNKLCQDVAVIPFLWVLPLALYLLSFIICFDSPRWYARCPFTLALIAAIVAMCWTLFKGTSASLYQQLAVYNCGLFVCCMVCHGELYRLRPDPQYLTGFYLMIAGGGALGGAFVAVIAPMIFTDYYELHWGLLLCASTLMFVCAQDQKPISVNQWRWLACALSLVAFAGLDWSLARLAAHYKIVGKGSIVGLRIGLWASFFLLAGSWIARKQFRAFRHWRFAACVWLTLGSVALGAVLWREARRLGGGTVYTARNFYGVLKVFEYRKNQPAEHHFLLQHGRITHGLQFVDAAEAVRPTTYYGAESGIGLAVRALPAADRRIGLVGLGTGTMSAYGQAGDYLRIYEINPQVKQLAMSRFTYLAHCPAKIDIAPGDARLSMEREPSQHFDLLVLDAFSSDAIPVHLLTKEAFALYERHLNTNGIIAVHVSNHYLDLEPVVVNLARHFKYRLASISFDETEDEWWLYSSTWILLTRSQEIINAPAIRAASSKVNTNSVKVPLWTDDFASLFQILK